MAERDRRQRDIHDELRLRPMPEIGAGGAHGKIGMRFQEGAFFARWRARRRLAPESTAAWPACDLVLDLVPQPAQAPR